jgi:hypothetical protein
MPRIQASRAQVADTRFVHASTAERLGVAGIDKLGAAGGVGAEAGNRRDRIRIEQCELIDVVVAEEAAEAGVGIHASAGLVVSEPLRIGRGGEGAVAIADRDSARGKNVGGDGRYGCCGNLRSGEDAGAGGAAGRIIRLSGSHRVSKASAERRSPRSALHGGVTHRGRER